MENDNTEQKEGAAQQTAPITPPSAKNPFKRILYHPTFNVVCGLVTILSMLFAVWTWKVSIKERLLTVYMNPTRTPIVQKGQLDSFAVTFKGMPVEGDLSSAEIQIWNAGKESIRHENILQPIRFMTPSNEPIYQVTMKTTRSVTGFTNYLGTNGSFTLDWNILEQDDGAKLQLIHGGNVNLELLIDGIIEGQSKFGRAIPYNAGGKWRDLARLLIAIPALLISGVIGGYLGSYFSERLVKRLQKTKLKSYSHNLSAMVFIAITCGTSSSGLILAYLSAKYFLEMSTPPFGW